MGVFDNIMLKLDETITGVLGQWDIYSTCITVVALLVLLYQAFTGRDPDIHPMLLERQSQPSPVRNPGESAVFRSHSSPHGIPLNSGLNVKDPGESKWARGRDGDLRDVWKRIVNGHVDSTGKSVVEKGRIITVLGSEQVIEHDLFEISRRMSMTGEHMKKQGARRVAIYLPNSIEFLEALFACVWYGMTPILLPYDQSPTTVISMLKESKADSMVAAVGSIPYEAVTNECPSLRRLIWVVDEGNRHMDWDEIPKGTGGVLNVSTWQEIVEDGSWTMNDLPVDGLPPNLVSFWQTKGGEVGEIVEFSQSNIVSAISAQLSAIPAAQRIGPSDLFLPADSLSTIYPLVTTLTALYSNASLALNSVAGSITDLQLATQGIAPTIIVVSALTMSNTQREASHKMTSPLKKLVHWFQTRSLTQNGVMPVASMLLRINDSLRPAIGNTPGKLRLIFVSERVGVDTPPLSSADLSDLRIFTGARIIYALTAAEVAGAVSQTTFYDYRVDDAKQSHFGAPVGSVEILLKDTRGYKTTDVLSIGKIIVRGPAVVGGETDLGAIGTIRDDYTLAYLS